MIAAVTTCSSQVYSASLLSLSLLYEMRCRNLEAINVFSDRDYLQTVRLSSQYIGERPSIDRVLGHITAYLGLHHAYVVQYQLACYLLEEALSLLDDNQSRLEKAQAQIMLAWVNHVQGAVHRTVNLLKEIIPILRKEGDIWWYILAITHLGWAYISIGKVDESAELYHEAFRLVEPGDLRLGIPIRNGLARVYYLQENYASRADFA
jgi:tetratricopeptide (TPR) repeat protein